MAFGRPHRLEPVAVGESGALEQQPVPLVGPVLAGGEVEHAHRHRSQDGAGAGHGGGVAAYAALGLENDVEPAGEGPEQFEHRDVERQARDGEPHARLVVLDDLVHGCEEVDDVAMLEHHALGRAGRARRVDDVRQVGRTVRSGCGWFARGRVGSVGRVDHRHVAVREQAGDLTLGEQGDEPRIGHHEAQPVLGICGIERDVGGPALERGEHADEHVDPAMDGDPDPVARTHAGGAQPTGQLVHLGGELGVRQRPTARRDRRRLGCSADLVAELAVDRHGPVVVEVGVVECVELGDLGRTEHLERAHRGRRIGHGGPQQRRHLAGDAVGGGGVDTIEAVVEREPAATGRDGEAQRRRVPQERCRRIGVVEVDGDEHWGAEHATVRAGVTSDGIGQERAMPGEPGQLGCDGRRQRREVVVGVGVDAADRELHEPAEAADDLASLRIDGGEHGIRRAGGAGDPRRQGGHDLVGARSRRDVDIARSPLGRSARCNRRQGRDLDRAEAVEPCLLVSRELRVEVAQRRHQRGAG